MRMDGRTAIVTGGSGALGSALVALLLEEGATVVSVDRAPGDSAERLIRMQADITNEASIQQVVERVASTHGKIDALFNVAGGFRPGTPVDEMTEEYWDGVMQLNLKSAFFCIKHALRVMKRQNYGRIVSVAARTGLRGEANLAAYSISKSGVILLTQSVADEVKSYDITANAVLPSTIDTPPNRAAMPDADFASWVAPRDLAEVMLFLGSEAGRAVSGAAVPVYNKA